jgi:CRISPR-associated protein Csb2
VLALGFRFRAGRYHATPWGRHVNEGEVAWPPSTWSLARALLATWHRKTAPGAFPEGDLQEILAALASEAPCYDLPRAVHAHSRHFMPIPKGRSATTTLVVDAFARLDVEAELVIAWPGVELPDRLQPLLDGLLERLGYLGRAESWVEARRLPDWSGRANCMPLNGSGAASEPAERSAGDPQELVELLVPRAPEDYGAFRDHMLEGLAARGLKPAERRKLERTLPRDWLEALRLETSDLQAAGWSRPPAARVQSYLRPEGILQPRAESTGPPVHLERRPTTARYALYGRPLPRLEDAVKMGEALRDALVHQASRVLDGEPAPPVFAGHRSGEDNEHRHAYYLPEDSEGNGLIDHLVVHAAEGFGEVEEQALGALRKLWLRSGEAEWQVVLEAVEAREVLAEATPLLRRSAAWTSVTPYLHPWYAKKRFRVEDQIRKECRLRDFPNLVGIEPLEAVIVGGRERRPIHFHRFRSKRGLPQPDPLGGFWRLTFAEPTPGPLALGFGCHFGLGLFRPDG